MDVEEVKIYQTSKYYVSYSTKFKDTTDSSQKEQTCLYHMAALVLLTIRQYQDKSYRMFIEWLVEAYYLRVFLQLSHIYLILQRRKRARIVNNICCYKRYFFIPHTYRYKTQIRRNRFNWIQDYTCIVILYGRDDLKRKYAKLSI